MIDYFHSLAGTLSGVRLHWLGRAHCACVFSSRAIPWILPLQLALWNNFLCAATVLGTIGTLRITPLNHKLKTISIRQAIHSLWSTNYSQKAMCPDHGKIKIFKVLKGVTRILEVFNFRKPVSNSHWAFRVFAKALAKGIHLQLKVRLDSLSYFFNNHLSHLTKDIFLTHHHLYS